jgi:hypothetical protein
MRVEVTKDSALPAKVMEFDYTLHHVGMTLRASSSGLMQTDILQLQLPRIGQLPSLE